MSDLTPPNRPPEQPSSILPFADRSPDIVIKQLNPFLRVLLYDSTILIGLLFVVVMLYKIGSVDFYSLSNPEYMRGVLTITIVLSFVVLGVILILGSLFGSRNGSKEESDERFRRAREVYAGVVGIVGTIVGFYFGSATTTGDSLQIKKTLEGNLLTIGISGGSRPYTVVMSSDKDGEDDKSFDSTDGTVKIDLCLFKDPSHSNYDVEVIDSRQVIKKMLISKPSGFSCSTSSGASSSLNTNSSTAVSTVNTVTTVNRKKDLSKL
jgi:uncharacterized membrane protein